MKKAFIVSILIIAFVFNAFAVETSAKSAILYEANTGTVLYEKNINEKRPIASTTKIMTAILTIEKGGLEDVVEVLPEQEGVEGTSLYLKAGEKISVKTLLYGLMLRSGNDAAETLAIYVAGDMDKFVKMMNDKAKNLGMKNTNFANPHGLPNDNHYSTAADMARLMSYAMKNETFREVVSTKTYTDGGRSFTNHNKLLNMSADVDGGKTGFTTAAGRCLVSSAVRDNMRLVAVTLFDPNDWDDHLNLYDYGFCNFKNNNVCTQNESITVQYIAGYGNVEVLAQRDFSLTTAVEDKVEVQIYLPRFSYAPLKKGQKLGEMHVLKNGEVIEKIPLISRSAVEITKERGLFEKLTDEIKKRLK